MHFPQELLYDNHLCIDGSKLEESGFSYNYPELTVEALREASVLKFFSPFRMVAIFLIMSLVADKLKHLDRNGTALNCLLILIFMSRCLMIMYRQDSFLLHWPSRDGVFNCMDAVIPLNNDVEGN